MVMSVKFFNPLAIALFSLFAVLSLGCDAPKASIANYGKIAIGMEKPEVDAIPGPGTVVKGSVTGSKRAGLEIEEVEWACAGGPNTVCFQGGKVAEMGYGKTR